MSDSINNKFEQSKNPEFLKWLSDTEKENLLQILQNEKKAKDANESITNATYDLIEKFETCGIWEQSPMANLLSEWPSSYYIWSGRSYGNHEHHCYIHDKLPVKIWKITLATIDSLIDKFSSYEAFALPWVNIDKNIDETSKGISVLDQAKLFELATRTYKWTFSGRKIIDPNIEFDYNGYHIKANLNDYRQELLVFKDGKVFPQKLTVHNKEKTLQEMRTYLQEKYSHINWLVNKEFPNIMKENGSMKQLNFEPWDNDEQHWIDTIDGKEWIANLNIRQKWIDETKVSAYDTHKDEYGISQELRLLFSRKNCSKFWFSSWFIEWTWNVHGEINILIGSVSYDIVLPNWSLYNKEALEHHTQSKIQRTEEENRQKILDILNNSQNQSRH